MTIPHPYLTSTLGGTIPLQIPVKEKLVFIGGLGLNSPHGDLTENLPVELAFQTNLSSASLSRCTLERIAVIWSRRPEFLPHKGLIQVNNQNQAWPSHIPILLRVHLGAVRCVFSCLVGDKDSKEAELLAVVKDIELSS
jgi:hypothetical protein